MQDTVMVEILKKGIVEELDKSYTEFKNEKLKELDLELEGERNRIVTSIMNGISIEITREFNSLQSVFNIRIEPKIVIKKE